MDEATELLIENSMTDEECLMPAIMAWIVLILSVRNANRLTVTLIVVVVICLVGLSKWKMITPIQWPTGNIVNLNPCFLKRKKQDSGYRNRRKTTDSR